MACRRMFGDRTRHTDLGVIRMRSEYENIG
jgi:hypothetical protein